VRTVLPKKKERRKRKEKRKKKRKIAKKLELETCPYMDVKRKMAFFDHFWQDFFLCCASPKKTKIKFCADL